MEKEAFNWAVLGPGGIAHKFARAVPDAPGAALYAVGSSDESRAKAFAAQYGVPTAYGSYEELAKDGNVDAVYVATPHPAHCENAILCLEHGKAVLCEKPLAINARFARRMADAAQGQRRFSDGGDVDALSTGDGQGARAARLGRDRRAEHAHGDLFLQYAL